LGGFEVCGLDLNLEPSVLVLDRITNMSRTQNTSKMVYSKQGYAPTTVDVKENPKAVDQAQSNLSLPEQPPVASDFNSADERTVNVGSGGQEGSFASGGGAIREPAVATGGPAAREAKDGLDGLPSDAVSREAKDHSGLANTTNKDYGYPSKNDPSSGMKQ